MCITSSTVYLNFEKIYSLMLVTVKLAFETFKLMLAGDERSGKDKIVGNYVTSVHNPAQIRKLSR